MAAVQHDLPVGLALIMTVGALVTQASGVGMTVQVAKPAVGVRVGDVGVVQAAIPICMTINVSVHVPGAIFSANALSQAGLHEAVAMAEGCGFGRAQLVAGSSGNPVLGVAVDDRHRAASAPAIRSQTPSAKARAPVGGVSGSNTHR